jgi:hypothetical protein
MWRQLCTPAPWRGLIVASQWTAGAAAALWLWLRLRGGLYVAEALSSGVVAIGRRTV